MGEHCVCTLDDSGNVVSLCAEHQFLIDEARRDEREACAKIASDRAAVCQAAYDAGDKTEVHPLNEALHIAQLIRNRKP